MKCLCCNKELKEGEKLWHKSCIKKFFNSLELPIINNIERDISLNISHGKSITGVQPKLSYTSYVNVISKETKYYNNEFIIKSNTNRFKEIAQAEYVVMTLAKKAKINVCDFGLIKDNNDNFIYITKRFDRFNGHKIHVEDFCQLLGFPTENKYQGSYEQCVKKVINKFSNYKQLDIVEFYMRIIFSYLTLNSDMHLKNFSLIEQDEIKLSPQYDLLPVQLFVDDNEDLALTLNGKKKNLKRRDFIIFGNTIGVIKPERIIDLLLSYEKDFYTIIKESILASDLKNHLIRQMSDRFIRLR